MTKDDQNMAKIGILGICLFIAAFCTYVIVKGAAFRNNTNVGNTIYIGDEYKYVKHKDKQALEEKLASFEKRNGYKLLFYIIKSKALIGDGKKLDSFTTVSGNQLKIFLTVADSEHAFFFGEKVKVDQAKLNEYFEDQIATQLGTDLYETAIWDLLDYFDKQSTVSP